MINGLKYIPDFISEIEESNLISTIDLQQWSDYLKRRTQHYGYRYDYTKKKIDDTMCLGPIPGWLDVYAEKLLNEGFFEKKPDQVIINEYVPGKGIARHVDCVPCFGDAIASLSLGSTCAMDFEHLKTSKKGSTILGPRSLLVLTGEARYDWMHSIPARLDDFFEDDFLQRSRRVSLTFRTIKII